MQNVSAHQLDWYILRIPNSLFTQSKETPAANGDTVVTTANGHTSKKGGTSANGQDANRQTAKKGGTGATITKGAKVNTSEAKARQEKHSIYNNQTNVDSLFQIGRDGTL